MIDDGIQNGRKITEVGQHTCLMNQGKDKAAEVFAEHPALAVQAIKLNVPPLICGVYFLVKDGVCVYVGQSVSILVRAYSHIRQRDFDSIFYIEVPIENLGEVERYWIDTLDPIFNRHGSRRRRREGGSPESWHVLKKTALAYAASVGEPSIFKLKIRTGQAVWLCRHGIATIPQLKASSVAWQFADQIERWNLKHKAK